MKRKIVIALMILLCFLLQSTVFQALAIGSISPNLMIILTASFGFMGGRKEGMIVGFFCGLLEDIFYGNGQFNRIFYGDDIKLPLSLISASELIYGLGTYMIMFVMRSRFAFFHYLTSIILPELLYTVIVTLFIYRLIYKINVRLKTDS